eukprot:jgi/Mesvir1/28451/Mv15874-RA.1
MRAVALSQIDIIGFKSFKAATSVHLNSHFTVLTGGPFDGQAVTRDEFKRALHGIGINVAALERYVVTQNRLAIPKLQEPSSMLKFLEGLIGHEVDFEVEIASLLQQRLALQKERAESAQRADELNRTREHLAPHVRLLEEYECKLGVFNQRKASFLKRLRVDLLAKVEGARERMAQLEVKVASLEEKQEAARSGLHGLAQSVTKAEEAVTKEEQAEQDAVEEMRALQIRKVEAEVAVKREQAAARKQKAAEAALRKELASLAARVSATQGKVVEEAGTLAQLEQQLVQASREHGEYVEQTNGKRGLMRVSAEAVEERAVLEDELQGILASVMEAEGLLACRESDVAEAASKAGALSTKLAAAEEAAEVKANAAAARAQVAVRERERLDKEQAATVAGIHRGERSLAELELQLRECYKALATSSDRTSYSAHTLAIRELKGLHPALYGRLGELATVQEEHAGAVNAVLSCSTNLATTLVVEDRATALAIVHHFAAKKIGVVSCDIRCELAHLSSSGGAKVPGAMTPLIDLVHLRDPSVRVVFLKYLRGWFLVLNRDVAARLISRGQAQGCNLVTAIGEVFREDGEIIASSRAGHGGKAPPSPFHLKTKGSGSDGDMAAAQEEEPPPSTAMGRKQAAAELEETKRNIAAEQQQLLDLKLKQHKLQQALESLPRPGAHPEESRAAGSADSAGSAAIEGLRRRLQVGEAELAACQMAAADQSKLVARLRKKQSQVSAKLAKLQAETCDSKQLELEQRKSSLTTQVAAAKEQLRRSKARLAIQEQALQERQVSCGKGEGKRGEEGAKKKGGKGEDGPKDKGKERIKEAKEKLKGVEASIAATEERLNACHASLKEATQQLRDARQQVATGEAELAALQHKAASHREKLDELESRVAAFEKQLARVDAGLEEVVEAMGGRLVVKRCKGEGGKEAGVGEDGGEDDGAESDFEAEGETDENKLCALEDELETLKKSIDTQALQQDLDCRNQLAALRAQDKERGGMCDDMARAIDALEVQRHESFTAAMEKVNAHLGAIYRQLNPSGDAYCSYAQDDPGLLFANGVTFNVRPDKHKWRAFSCLSGGQQALASLALSLSLQAVFPSPFNFFDEVDGSLDTRNAHAIASYIKAQNKSQYILVSHRPQVYELASMVAGVYLLKGESAVVTAIMSEIDEEEARQPER